MIIKSVVTGFLTLAFSIISATAFAAVNNPELPSRRAALETNHSSLQQAALVNDDGAVSAADAAKLNSEAEAQEPAPPTLIARIDLTKQRMTVSSEGRRLHTWRISSGRRGYETPNGSFQPTWMARRWYSRQYRRAPMPYSVFFNRGIATHGTSAVKRLGRAASHGCIRLRTSNARAFYKLVQQHGKDRTQIIVTGRAKQPRYVKKKYRTRGRTYRTARYSRKKRVPLYQRRHFRQAFSND